MIQGLDKNCLVGIVGSGAMGSGIAQVAATAGHEVRVYDNSPQATEKASQNLSVSLKKLQDKGKIKSAAEVMARVKFVGSYQDLSGCGLVIEAITEQADIKKSVFRAVEAEVGATCILATNTSSLSVTSIASACVRPERVIGLHFFNPAPVMALVEVVPAIQTDASLVGICKRLMGDWGKTAVVAKDTPGFIVNRVARPYYGEAIRIMEEGIADEATIDWAMTDLGGFKMGPFALMDFIGHDVNFVVTETVYQSFYYDPKYRPSFSQKRLLEAGWLGKKTGRGFYSYGEGVPVPYPKKDLKLARSIVDRILAMLINEAVDALYLKIATAEDLETAMTKGVNYPKGLLHWCDEWGADHCLRRLDCEYNLYHDDRYRASLLLRKHAFDNQKFFL